MTDSMAVIVVVVVCVVVVLRGESDIWFYLNKLFGSHHPVAHTSKIYQSHTYQLRLSPGIDMRGEFSRSTITKRQRSVWMQQGRVQQDADWNERMDLQVHDELIYLEVWERDVGPTEEDNSITDNASASPDGPDTTERDGRSSRKEEGAPVLRLTRDAREGCATSILEITLDNVEGDDGGIFELPRPEITIDGSRWEQVSSFSGSGPQDRVYVIEQKDDGPTTIEFGDGKSGARPPVGSRVIASYRFGSGRSGHIS